MCSCGEKKSGNDTGSSSNTNSFLGTWVAQEQLPLRMGMDQFLIELRENGTCEIRILRKNVMTQLSYPSDTQIRLMGKWNAVKDGIETTTRIQQWDIRSPDGTNRKQAFDDYDVRWTWKISEDNLKNTKMGFLLFAETPVGEEAKGLLSMSTKNPYLQFGYYNFTKK